MDKVEKKEDAFEVWPENWDAVGMFLRVQTQWIVGMSGAVGLNYQSLEFLFKLYRTKKRKEVFEEICEIEFGALEAMKRTDENKAGKNGA